MFRLTAGKAVVFWLCLLFIVLINPAAAFAPQTVAPYTLKFDGAGHQRIVETVADVEGNLYLVGYFEAASGTGGQPALRLFADTDADGERELTSGSPYSLAGKNSGGRDIFVAKLNWLGELLWVKTAGGSGNDVATGVVYEPRHNQLFISGYFHNIASFDLQDLEAVSSSSGLQRSSTTNLFVAKLDIDDGEWLDVQALPIEASVLNGNSAVSSSVKGVQLGSDDAALGNGLVLAIDDSNPASDVALYLKGQVRNALNVQSSSTPGNSQQWLASLGLAGKPKSHLAMFYRKNNQPATTPAGDWAFVARVDYASGPNVNNPWQWRWLTRLDTQVVSQAGAESTPHTSCDGKPLGSARQFALGAKQVSRTFNSNDAGWSSYREGVSIKNTGPTYNFTDPLPEGATILSVAVTTSAYVWWSNGAYAKTDARINGQQVGSVTVTSPDAVKTMRYNRAGDLPGYHYGGTNQFRLDSWWNTVYLKNFTIDFQYALGDPDQPQICHAQAVVDMTVNPAAGLDSDLYLAGDFRGNIKLSANTNIVSETGNNGAENGFVAALKADGTRKFFSTVGGRSSVQSLLFDEAQGRLMTAGYVQSSSGSSVTMDSYNSNNDVELSTANTGVHALIAKLNLNGRWLWADASEAGYAHTLVKNRGGDYVFAGYVDGSTELDTGGSASDPIIVNVSAYNHVNSQNHWRNQSLTAGAYTVTPVNTNQGGEFTAWSAWDNTQCADRNGCTTPGWQHSYVVNASGLEAVLGSNDWTLGNNTFNVVRTSLFPNEGWAFKNAGFAAFVLASDTTAKFAINDSNNHDNHGGVSLKLTRLTQQTAITGRIPLLVGFRENEGSSGVAVQWRKQSTAAAPYAYGDKLYLNNLNTLYLIGSSVSGHSQSTTFANRDNSGADTLVGEGSVLNVLDITTGEFLPEFQRFKEYTVGEMIDRPAGALVPETGIDNRRTFPPNLVSPTHQQDGESLQQRLYTAGYNQEWYAAGATDGARVLWPVTNDPVVQLPPLVGRAIRVRWPTVAEGLQEYVYGNAATHDTIPDVDLNPEDRSDEFISLLWSEDLNGQASTSATEVALEVLSGKKSLQTRANGYSALLFHDGLDPYTSAPRIQAVRAYRWDEKASVETATIGQEVTPPADAMTGKTGYPMRPLSKHDPDPQVYDPSSRKGQLIPVNVDRNPAVVEDDDLRIAWYEEDDAKRDWPFRTVTYTLMSPTDADAGLVVIASERCSAGAKGRDTAGNPVAQVPLANDHLSNLQLYVQNDPDSAGFNPNEEHGLMTQLAGDTVVCALRSELAVTTRGACDNNPQTAAPACFTSYPQLIVKAVDSSVVASENNSHALQPWVYRVYNVRLFDDNYPTFDLASGEAGNALQPPFPLTLPGFSSAQTQGAGTPFWVDVNGQVWARSAGNLTAQYFYPATSGSGDFFIDTDGDGSNDASEVGDIPWLANADDPATNGSNEANDAAPLPLTYSIDWPAVVPELEIGDTLTDQRDNGLPAVRNMKTVDVIFDQHDAWDPKVAGSQSTPTRHLDASLRVFDFTVPIGQPPCTDSGYSEGSYCNQTVNSTSGDALVIGSDGAAPSLPARIYLDNGQWYFPSLPSHLRYRLFFDPTRGSQNSAGDVSGEFTFRGGDFDGETGRPHVAGAGSKLTLINIMNASERDTLKLLDNDDGFTDDVDDKPNSAWDRIVDALYDKTRNPGRLDLDGSNGPDRAILAGFELDTTASGVETQHQQGTGESALTAAFARRPGYITIAENNVIDGSGDPVNVHVLKIIEPRARGALRVLRNADNKLDERLVVRHDLDFGGRDGMTFEWWWRPDNGAGIPSVSFDNVCAEPGATGCPSPFDGWLRLGESSDNSYTLRAGLEILADGWVLARYKGLPTESDPAGDDWVGYAGQYGIPVTETRPVATAGWVKRVLEGINAFEQRYDDLAQNAPVTYSSFLVQAGRPYAGDVALNADNGILNAIGLIELYQTVLNRAMALSIEAIDPITEQEAVNKQLLLAANRLAEFSMILGDEAFADAQDPTVGVVESGGTATYLSPNQFAFQNQVPTLLDEELALLRGREMTDPYPRYNRLPWNFSAGDGEPVYVQVYGITDQNDPLGAVDDAERLFPQGHGDALGYYLDATQQYYRLALHPNYDWQPLTETTTIGGVAVEVDYSDEQTFAQAASRKARTSARILDLTYRKSYQHDPAAQWTGYPDTDRDRRWGVDGWARRGAQGAYLDYALANALLKSEMEAENDLQKIDRLTVTEVSEITAAFSEIESLVDMADKGRNPLGLSADAVPFDISPSRLEGGETHFDQIYSRAVSASVNALQVFNYANDLTQAIRTQQFEQGDLQAQVDAREQEFKHRLIELYGYPYAGDKGPNATYPSDYTGADLYHFMYLNASTIDGDDAQGLMPATAITEVEFVPSFSPDKDSIGNPVAGAGRDLVPRDVLNDPTGSEYQRWFDVDPNRRVAIPFPYATAGDYAFTAPNHWGKRQAAGKIQLALMDMVRLQARLQAAITRQLASVEAAKREMEVLEALNDIDTSLVEARNTIMGTYTAMEAVSTTLKHVSAGFKIRGEALYRVRDVVGTNCTPFGDNEMTVGMATSVPTFHACAMAMPRTAFILGNLAFAENINYAQIPFEYAASVASLTGRISFNTLSYPRHIATQLKAIEAELNRELELRYQVAEVGQELEIAAANYEALVAEGMRVLQERVTYRRNIARLTTDARYQDYVYRVFRNDALQKYRASFDLAARYTYLAAKAFDYETGLLAGDPANGNFLDAIVKQRSLGQFNVASSNIGNSTPLANVEGLSDPLAKMKQAYDAMAANFDNVYDQNVRFSLRQEMLRIPAGSEFDDAWEQALSASLVANLWDLDEFRQYAVAPRTEAAGPLPGLVLRFSTQINSGMNLFGWPLGPGDAAYSATYSATKFRRVGIDLRDYDGNSLLASTPYLYLLPVGMDVLRSPTQIDRIRQYAVVEQAIPVPVDLVNGGGYQAAGWIPSLDGISATDSWDAQRKHPQLQAGWGANSGQLQPLASTRLVGRSVWNTEWLLVIPGAGLLADEQEGLRRLIRGDGSGNGISDIELFFESFSVQ